MILPWHCPCSLQPLQEFARSDVGASHRTGCCWHLEAVPGLMRQILKLSATPALVKHSSSEARTVPVLAAHLHGVASRHQHLSTAIEGLLQL